MKIFFYSVLCVVFLLLCAFFLLFTSVGNSLIKPLVEDLLKYEVHDSLTLKTFELSTSEYSIAVDINGSIFQSKAKINLLSKDIDGTYVASIKDLSVLQKLTKTNLYGAFDIQGTIKGTLQNLKIRGYTNIFDGQTVLELEVLNKNPQALYYIIEKANPQKIFEMLDMKINVDGFVNSSGKIDSLDPNNLAGLANISLEGFVNQITYKDKVLNVDKVPITSTGYLELKQNKASFNIKSISNLFNFYIKSGEYDTYSKDLKFDYVLEAQDISQFNSLFDANMQGSLLVMSQSTSINDFDYKSIKTDTKVSLSSFAIDFTKYNISFLPHNPMSVGINVLSNNKKMSFDTSITSNALDLQIYNTKLDLELNDISFVYSLKVSDLSAIQTETQKAMSGELVAKSDVNFVKDFDLSTIKSDQKISLTNFVPDLATHDIVYPSDKPISANINLKIDNNKATINTQATSKIFTLKMGDSLYDIKNNYFVSNYTLKLPDLSLIKPFCDTDVRGQLDANGVITQKGKWQVSAMFDIADGSGSIVLDDNLLYIKGNNLAFDKLSYMLHIPQAVQASTNISLNHNLDTKKGTLSIKLINGRFVENQMMALVARVNGFDLSKEVFENAIIDANIDDKIVNASLDATSKHTKIYAQDCIINKEQELIDTVVNVNLNNSPKNKEIKVYIKGDLKNPSVSLDAKALIKNTVNNVIEKHQETINKIVPKEVQEPIKKAIDNFLNRL